MKNKTIYLTILIYLAIIVLGSISALNYVLFIIQNEFAPAGINGVAVMIQYKLGFSVGYLSLLINIPLCIFAFFFIDKRFALRSFSFVVSYSLFFLLFSNIEAIKDYAYISGGIDTIYPATIAGLITGVIYSVAFKLSASTGGTDVIAKYVSKKKPNLNFFWVTFSINIVVAIVSCFVYKKPGMSISYKPACLCILYSFVVSLFGNFLISKGHQAYIFTIVTSNPEIVEDKIVHELKHSATRISSQGVYSNENKTTLLCVVNIHQLVDFERIVKECPDTFAFYSTANSTIGNFKKIKSK